MGERESECGENICVVCFTYFTCWWRWLSKQCPFNGVSIYLMTQIKQDVFKCKWQIKIHTSWPLLVVIGVVPVAKSDPNRIVILDSFSKDEKKLKINKIRLQRMCLVTPFGNKLLFIQYNVLLGQAFVVCPFFFFFSWGLSRRAIYLFWMVCWTVQWSVGVGAELSSLVVDVDVVVLHFHYLS